MKKILTLALTLALTGGLMSVSAQEAKDCPKGKECKKEACKKEECNKGQCEKAERGACPEKCDAFNPFEGIELTDAQKAQLEALKCEKPANCDQQCAAGDKKDCSKEKCGKAECKKDCKKERKECIRQNARQAKAERLAKIKEILTPEQYVKFLENNYLRTEPRHNKGQQMKAKKAFGDKADKADKPSKMQKAPRRK